MKMRHARFLALAAAIGAIAWTMAEPAGAQVSAEQQSALRANCRSDFMSKCSGVSPGGKDALACLQKNVASLAPACKNVVSATLPAPAPTPPAAAKPAAPAPAPAAAAPMAAPPPPAPAAVAAPSAPAPATVKQAPPPRAALPSRPSAPVAPAKTAATPPAAAPAAPVADAPPPPTAAQISAIKFSCRRDLSRNCRGVTDGAESIACLQRNAGKLAPDCKTSLADIADTAPLAPVAAGTPAATRAPNAPVVMTAVIGRACLRDLALHCRNTGVGDGQKIACLTARGSKLAPLCKAALKITGPAR
jgi:hypothetical protein